MSILYLPLIISGSENLLPIKHNILKASAQIKSALIIAALNIHGKTKIVENIATRDHTERLLKFLNIKFKIKKTKKKTSQIELNGPYEFKAKNINVAGDPSSASFFIVGALILPKSKIIIKDVTTDRPILKVIYLKTFKKEKVSTRDVRKL